MQKLEKIAALIAGMTPLEGSQPTAIPGVYLTRLLTTDVPRQSLSQAVFCMVAQGSKTILLDKQRFTYDPSTYLLVALDLPAVGEVIQASRQEPFLGASLVLDFAEIDALITEAGLAPRTKNQAPLGIGINTLDEELLDAVLRLLCLLKKPSQISVLAPLIRREIYFRLLLSPQGDILQRLSADNGRAQRIARGLQWLRENAARTIRMEELAREVGMSASSMHHWFRSVTSLSPVQYQKQLRLQQARSMMVTQGMDAGHAGRSVGYGSASQFSRDYRRFFGAPPMKDVERLRTTAAVGSGG